MTSQFQIELLSILMLSVKIPHVVGALDSNLNLPGLLVLRLTVGASLRAKRLSPPQKTGCN